MPKYAERIDGNQTEIVKALRRIPGVSVEVGHDDILVGFKGKTYWYECKSPDKISKDGTPYNLKPSQKRLLETYKGHYRIIWTLEQILDDLK